LRATSGLPLGRANKTKYLDPAANFAAARSFRMSQRPTTPDPSKHPGYADYFSNDANSKPVILTDGTSVLFPKDWTDEDAGKWRRGMALERPSPQSSHHLH
jgi:hypothetical protein